jgi:Uma2 family endonuclease
MSRKTLLTADDLARMPDDDSVLAPDVAFVRQDRVEAIRSKSFAKGAPDLAVEIFSPSDGIRQTTRKVERYLAAGCHTVWVVYPKREEIKVLEASGADRTLHAGDLLEAPELLPGFSVRVAELFG